MTVSQKIQDDTKVVLEKALHHVQEVLRGVRTGRATSALVDNIKVDYYGTMTPLSQMAAISTPEPRQILIKPFDMSSLQEVTKAIQKSDLGITPQSDGKVLRLNLPALSGEQRTKYAHKVKEIVEEARVAMRNGRRDMNKHSDAELKAGKLTEDEHRKLHDKVQEMLKEYEKKLDGILEKKVAEIQQV